MTPANNTLRPPGEPATPLFRWILKPSPPAKAEGNLPAAVPGQCRPERIVMAACLLSVVLTAGMDVTAGIPIPWLRLAAAPVAGFVLLHIVMILLAVAVPLNGSLRQAWLFLAVATAYAAARWAMQAPGAWLCLPWLTLMALNGLAVAVLRFSPRTTRPEP